jgi:hypothetical protein
LRLRRLAYFTSHLHNLSYRLTTATITWTTDETSSSQVEYGLTSSYGNSTSEADTSPRVTSHSVVVSSLLACRRYYYRVKSSDAASNQAVFSQNTFTTTGCDLSSVDIGNESNITTASGGEFELTNNSSTAKLTVPDGFAGEDADFQINKLSTSGVTPPSGKNLAEENIYDLSAVTSSNSDLTSFDKNVTFTVTYGSDTESSFDESTLDVYKYNSGTSSWDDQNCTLDTAANTLTCSLGGFSTYGVFGEEVSDADSDSDADITDDADSDNSSYSSESSSSENSEPSPKTCTDQAPSNAPNLFQIDTTADTATLYFAPATETSDYYVSFSENEAAEEHGAELSLDYDGVQQFTVEQLNPNTTYYFKVRGQNGCMPGEWSQVVSATTKVFVDQTTQPTTQAQLIEETDQEQSINKLSGSDKTTKPEPESEPATHSAKTVKTKLTIKIEDNGQPLGGVDVELHSDPKYGITDENGVVTFRDVDPGEHTLKLAYADYQAERKIAVSGEKQKEELTISVTLVDEKDWQDYLMIGGGGFLAAVSIMGIGWWLKRQD